jgi:hypothetical protein
MLYTREFELRMILTIMQYETRSGSASFLLEWTDF